MPVTPEEFVDHYLPIAFTACDAGGGGEIQDGASVQVHIRKYINANFRYKKNKDGTVKELKYEPNKGMPYTEMKEALRQFTMDRARKDRYGLHLFAENYIMCWDTTPEISLHQSLFMHAFTGKVAPSQLRDILRLYTYWHSVDSEPRKHWATPQAFADQCLGLDCNGYTGAYFFTQYSHLGIVPNTDIGSYDSKYAKAHRKRLAEIETLDVIIWPGYVHIALIGKIVSRTKEGKTETLRCNVCQSTGTNMNGLTKGEAKITTSPSGSFLVNGSEVKSIVRIL